MANVSGIGTTWNLPNYAGELFTADATQTPLLSMIGGLTGGRQTDNFEFPTSVLYNFPDASQPAISETASVTAPAASELVRSQEKNVVQIFQEAIQLTYAKQSNSGRMSGISTAGQQPNPADEKAWQIEQRLKKIARDVEFSFIQGAYQISTAADVANKTRGLLELCSGGTTIAASSAALSKTLLNTLFREMANNGALFDNIVIFVGAYQKQALTDVFSSLNGFVQPSSRNVGGINITEIETDFCKAGIVWDRFMPAGSLLVADVAHIAPVFQAVPGKGVLFEEPLAKTGAADALQIYGQLGLAHGPAFLHGSITGLATAQGGTDMYVFAGKGIVWDKDNDKALANFVNGSFETDSEEAAEKLKALGYECTSEPEETKKSKKTGGGAQQPSFLNGGDDMAQIDTLALLLGISDDEAKKELAQFELDKAGDMIMNYCKIESIPDALGNIMVSMAADLYRADNPGSEAAAVGPVKSITEGDSSVSFGSAAGVSDNPAMSFLKDYTAQLNRFRKVGWQRGVDDGKTSGEDGA